MAENGYGKSPAAGHVGRIPNFGKTHVNPMGNVEPPACIQNAMMTKDKKPFTYTPGGLDLSQIRTPSMARRLARQQEGREQTYAQQPNGSSNYHPQGGAPPPPPSPPQGAPVPPPPPPLVIEVAESKSPKPIAAGQRPEIVIPENPIGMLRKTNSPYHWESEKAELQKMGPVPKFVEKVPSPLTVQMPPASFSQQPPQTYKPVQNNVQRPNYQYNQANSPGSPLYKPEAQYANQPSPSPREILQRQDSQFNNSPQPFIAQSPISNGSPYSPSPNTNWKKPESPSNNSPQTPPFNRTPYSPQSQQYSPNYYNQPPNNSGPVFHTLPRNSPRNQGAYSNNPNNTIYNNISDNKPQSPKLESDNIAPWRNNNTNQYSPSQQQNQTNNHQAQNNTYIPPWMHSQNAEKPAGVHQPQRSNPPSMQTQANKTNNQVNYSSPWRAQETVQTPPSQTQTPLRYQSTMSIPVTPRKENTQSDSKVQREVVYVNEEPVYYCSDSPQSIPPWVKTQKEKTKTPPPVWCQRPLEGRKSAPRELATPPKDTEPEWVRVSNEKPRSIREVVSPPKYQQPAQPNWSTRPSENRKSVPKDSEPTTQGSRIVPIQIEGSERDNNQRPQLRIMINLQNNGQQQAQAPYSQPTQRIMRVLSPQLVRLDDGQPQQDLPSLNYRSYQNNDESKTRIIPIQIEGGGNNGANKSFGGRY